MEIISAPEPKEHLNLNRNFFGRQIPSYPKKEALKGDGKYASPLHVHMQSALWVHRAIQHLVDKIIKLACCTFEK